MTTRVTHDVQTTVENYLKEVPRALGHLDYEVRGDRVIAHAPDGTVVIDMKYEGERKLGALSLPMTHVEISLIGFADDKAEAFLKHYDAAMMRAGGG